MVLLAVLEGQSLSAFIGVCFLIFGVVTFVWNQRAWDVHTYLGRVFLFLLSASLLSGGLMFLGLVNYLEHTRGPLDSMAVHIPADLPSQSVEDANLHLRRPCPADEMPQHMRQRIGFRTV